MKDLATSSAAAASTSPAGPSPRPRVRTPSSRKEKVAGLDALLSSLGLSDRKDAALRWCEAEAVMAIAMIAEADACNHFTVDAFSTALEVSLHPLTATQRGVLRDRLYLARDGMRSQLLTQFGFSSSSTVVSPPSPPVLIAPSLSPSGREGEVLLLQRALRAAEERARASEEPASNHSNPSTRSPTREGATQPTATQPTRPLPTTRAAASVAAPPELIAHPPAAAAAHLKPAHAPAAATSTAPSAQASRATRGGPALLETVTETSESLRDSPAPVADSSDDEEVRTLTCSLPFRALPCPSVPFRALPWLS